MPPEPSSIFYYLKLSSGIGHKEACNHHCKMGLLNICHIVSIQQALIQLHGGMISHMQVLATPSSIVHNTKSLDPYHWKQISFSCLFFRQWYRYVTTGADGHLDKTFIRIGCWKVHSFFQSLSKIFFFSFIVNGPCVPSLRTFLKLWPEKWW